MRSPAGILLLLVLVLGALLGGRAAAQTATAGAIRGRVTDAAGQPVFLASVSASSPSLLGTRSELTDADGAYRLNDLPIGTYRLLFVFDKAKVRRENIEVTVGSLTVVN